MQQPCPGTTRFPTPLAILVVLAAVAVACNAPSASTPTDRALASSGMSEWEQTVAAARREGKIVIIGPQGDEVREVLTKGFSEKYPEIEVELASMAGNQAAPKILTEQAAGVYVTDLVIQGPTTVLHSLRPAGAVVPVRPYLTGPDVGPTSAWRGGDYVFADEAAQHSLMFSLYVREAFMYNADQVSPAEFTSWRDLLNPKWRGRIVLRDPRISGGGQAFAMLWYQTEGLGPEFIRQLLLLTQDLVISNDDTQINNWIARGQYAISIGAGNARFREFQQLGLPMRALEGAHIKEASPMTPGVGNLGVLANAPHPNAVKVYLNHLLSRDAQLAWTQVTGYPSVRQDIPTDHLLSFYVPKQGVKYFETYSDRLEPATEELNTFLRSVLPR
jgi:iron(III) transport system substrate-binding protein